MKDNEYPIDQESIEPVIVPVEQVTKKELIERDNGNGVEVIKPTNTLPILCAGNVTWEEIWTEISTTAKSMKTIAQEKHIDYRNIFKAIAASPELQEQRARARQEQADHIVEGIMDKLDWMHTMLASPDRDFRTHNSIVQAIRLEIDSIKWIACKYRPSLYGDRQELTVNIARVEQALREQFTVTKVE